MYNILISHSLYIYIYIYQTVVDSIHIQTTKNIILTICIYIHIIYIHTYRLKKIIRLIDTGHDGTVNSEEYFNFLMYHSDMKASDKAKAMRKSPFHVRFYKMLDTTLKYLRNPPGTSKAGKITARQKREAEELRKKKQQMMRFKQGAQQKRNNLLKLRRNRQLQVEQMYV